MIFQCLRVNLGKVNTTGPKFALKIIPYALNQKEVLQPDVDQKVIFRLNKTSHFFSNVGLSIYLLDIFPLSSIKKGGSVRNIKGGRKSRVITN